MSLLAAIDPALNVAKTVFGIGGLIFVHEFGHFLVGRFTGVKAEAFSIGFGPVLAKWKPGETEYRLSAVPLGGYVKFLGENPDERGNHDPRSFHAASYPRKAAIMLAGVTMNVIAAFVLFIEAIAPHVGTVVPGMPAWEYGLQPGDEFVSIDGARILDFTDIPQETVIADEVDVVVRRGDKVLPAITMPTRLGPEGLRMLGVSPPVRADGTIGVVEGSAAEEAGFRTGDRVVAVDEQPVTNLIEAETIHTGATGATTWTVVRDDERLELTLLRKPGYAIGVVEAARKLVVQRDSPAAKAGLRTRDEPVSVAEQPTRSFVEFVEAIGTAAEGATAVVRRGDEEIQVALPPAADRPAFLASIAKFPETDVYLSPSPSGASPAREAGLPPASRLVSVGGVEVTRFEELRPLVYDAGTKGADLELVWLDAAGERRTTKIRPAENTSPQLAPSTGITALHATVVIRETSITGAMALGLNRTHRWVMRIFGTLRSVFTGGVSGRKLAGPIRIAQMSYSSAKAGWAEFFLFLGMISMNLAVLNVLPIPLLDGGQLAVATVERVRGKPLSEGVLAGVQWVGLGLLLALMVYVLSNDIINLISVN